MNEHSTIQRFPLIGACRGRGKSLLIAVVTAFSAYVLSLSRLGATDYFVDTADDAVAADGKVSLREAIAASGSNQAVFDAPAGDTGTDVITFTSALNGATITLNDSAATVAIPGGPTVPLGGPLVVSDFLIMWDGNQTRVKIDAASKSRVFEIADGAKNVRLMNVRILNGSSAVSGGAIYVDAGEELELFDVIVSDSTAPDGGGIYNDGGKLTIDSSMVRDNAATGASGSGGGIFNNTGGTLVVKNSTVWANYANRAGGGIEDKSGPGLGVTLENTLIGKNNAGVLPAIAAPGNGGGLHVTGAGDVLITGGNSDGNVAAREGGALWNGTGTMTIDGTTIAGNLAKGSAADDGGGGIFNNGGTLAISNAEIRANIADGTSGSGGGILNLGGSVAIDSTLIIANEANRAGGGIEDSVGTGITITNSTLRENIAGPVGWAAPGNGGAVHITGAGKLELTGSTVADNVAAKEGGGLWNHGASEMYVGYSTVSGNTAPTGGGIFALAGAGVLDLVNSTVSGNNATLDGGGLALNGGAATFLSVTVAANNAAGSGGGLRVNGASVVSFNSLFGDNAAASGADVSGAFDLANNSLVESASGASGIADGVDGNIVGMDAVLGSLVDNGGPTLTHLPGAGSPAIDAGDSAAAAGLTGDQRGLVRIIGNVDMGSVELQMASVPLPFTDSVDANDGVTTLREMVIAANATPGSDTIELSAGTYVLTLPGSGEDVAATGDLDITDSLTITGAGPATIIDASALGDRVFEVFTGVDVKFSNLMITGGTADDGGGIYNRGGVVDVSACILQDNIANGASGSGGAIFNDAAGILTVSDSTISGNQANRAGGGIEDNSGAGLGIILTNVNLDGNNAGVSPATAAPGNGGGLHISGAGDTSIIGGTVNGNSAAREGGGLWNGSGTMTVEGVEIADNKAAGAAADDGGGGIFNNGGTLIVDTSDIRANLATGASGSGGGILNLGGSVTVTGTSIDANVANRAGGGIEDAAGTQLLLIATQMTDNVAGPDGTAAPGNGGALHISGAGHVELQDSTVAGNFAAKEGGGLWNSGVGMMSVYSSTVSGNSAPKGGGIFAQAGAAGDLQVTNSTVSGNTVTGNGAGIGLEGGSLFLLNSTVASNTATGMGGGIHITNSDVTLFNSIIGDNVAADGMDVSGMIGLASNTLIESGAGAMGISDGSDGNIVGQDAMLAPLANYGGMSETHLLMAGSAAINTGDDVAATGLTTDQRGLPRFFGAVDMGSVEKQDGEAGGSMVSTFADVVDANDGVVSLREAVIAANATAEADVIVLMPGTYALTLAGSGEDATATGDLDIAGSLSIVGAGEQTIIDASALGDRAFEVLAGSDATLSQLTITGGQADDGGAIYNRGTLDITKATLTNNVANGASGSGGAIFSAAGSGTSVTDSTISANVANRAGGGIEDASGPGLGLQLFNVVFDGNNAGVAPATAAPGNGGALHITGPGDVTISGGSVTNNVAAREGGGLWNGAGLMIIDDVMISANSAAGVEAHDGGGGVFNNGGKVEITGGMITGNSATGAAGSGGGIFNEVGGTVTVSGSTISANLANRAGGGIEDNSGAGLGVTLTNVMLDGNNAGVAPAVAAPGNGGAVHISGPGDIAITGGSITNNVAAREGGGLWNGAGLMTIDGVSISTNSAAGVEAHDGGGGVFNNGGKVEITGGMITGNSATGAAGSGGGIFNEVGGTVTVSGSTISANLANRAGGGIEDNSGAGLGVTLTNVMLDGNNAGVAPAVATPGNGGAVHISGPGDIAITGGSVTNNVAAREGGGLWNGSGTMTVSGVMISQNTATGDAADDGGGGIFNNGGTLTVDATTITGNAATGTAGSGGGLFSTAGSVTVSDSSITANVANRAGGGIEIVLGSLTLNATNLGGEMETDGNIAGPEGSAAPGNGGGLHVSGASTIAINGGTVRSNSAAREGGGLWNQVGATMTIANGTEISGNVASGNAADDGGGGIFDNGGTLVIDGSTLEVVITNNIAIGSDARGGGILSLNGTSQITGAMIHDNTTIAGGAGAGLTQHDGSALIMDSVISDDVAATGTAILAGGGTLSTVVLADSATLAPGEEAAILNAGEVSFASGTTLSVEIGGTTPGMGGYDQLKVADGVDLGGATLGLSMAGGYVPMATDTFVIVSNDGITPVQGMFAGLPMDAFFAFGAGTFRIDYASGDGNDVALVPAEQDGVALAIAGPPALNTGSGFVEQMVTLTNNQGTTVSLDRLYISGVPEGVTVQNASGSAPYGNSAVPTPYILVGAPIAPGDSTMLTVQFASADNSTDFSPAYNIEAGVQNVETFAVKTILFIGEDVLIEFASEVGVVYEVQYSSDLIDWKPVSPQLVGDSTITSWIDSGTPATESSPLAAGERYYRVVRIGGN